MWLTVVALLLALSSGCISLWCFLDLRERPRKAELRGLLEQSSQTLLTEYVRQFRALESEWDNMYQKFGRLAGRMDRERALKASNDQEVSPAPAPALTTRADLLRKWRNKQ